MDFGFPGESKTAGPHSAFPALLLAPGLDHQDQPLIKLLFEKAVRRGFVAVRFNWGFHCEGTQPSAGLQHELEDFRTVLAAAQAHPRVAKHRIFLAGKSLGAIVAHSLAKETSVKGTVLLTPLLPSLDGFERHYPGLREAEHPTVLLAGDRDESCPLPLLYAGLSGANERVKLIVVAGDHALKVGNGVQNRQNLEAACRMVLYWLRMLS